MYVSISNVMVFKRSQSFCQFPGFDFFKIAVFYFALQLFENTVAVFFLKLKTM